MTDHNSDAGEVGGGQAPGHPASFGAPSATPHQGGASQGGPHGQGTHQGADPQARRYAGYPQQTPSDAARAQVAAAWVRSAPQAAVPPSQAAVPTLPPRETGDATESKKAKRDRLRQERKAEVERKRAVRKERALARKNSAGKKSGKKGSTAGEGAADSAGPTPTEASTAGRSGPTEATPDKRRPTGRATGAVGAAFTVPAPGGRIPAGGRRTHIALRATVLATTCLFALGACTVTGLMIGKSGNNRTAALSKDDVKRYKLTEFPLDTAATFAEQYALVCMTFSKKEAENRKVALSRFISAGVDPSCGWTGEGSQTAVAADWDGSYEAIPEYGNHGRYMGVQVRMSTGNITSLVVPVYAKDLKTGQGLRVVGDVGTMPLAPGGKAPELGDANVDDALSAQLESRVLPGFFRAWGASDTTALSRFTTAEATSRTKRGLRDTLQKPSVTSVEALAPAGKDPDEGINYTPGQLIRANVSVQWAQPDGAHVVRSYRVTLENTAQGWFINDISGAVPDREGGAAKVVEPESEGGNASSPSASPETLSGDTDNKKGSPKR
ncbi:conjugal transfer protein [Streptomyces sp. NPDC057702]|uniref:conjugal transfer protein n=1 Tax=unclassified Streptomyces TaxID=2593676 RepID=UPI0036CD4EBE